MAPVNKKSPPSAKGQRTLLSFFQKSPGPPKASPLPKAPLFVEEQKVAKVEEPESSDTLESPVRALKIPDSAEVKSESNHDLSTPLSSSQPLPSSSPTRRVRTKRRMLIVDSDSEDEASRDPEDSDDDWEKSGAAKMESDNQEDEDITLVESSKYEDESDELSTPKSKHGLAKPTNMRPPAAPRSSPATKPPIDSSPTRSSISPSSPVRSSVDVSVSATESLAKFTKSSDYNPQDNGTANNPRTGIPPTKKVKVSEDPERYKWLLNIKDADGKSPDHPDYDPRTLYIPQNAWAKFTPFEKQYWEVKKNLWNTVVFFKKGKFYELYENDAAIAHQQFDLKLAGGGRANMSLCGVPEMSFDYWASAFIAKGYKVARVDQSETALGKEMRDIANKKKEEKIIRRELSFVLTGGTLTDASMLVSDLSQYCMAIKQDNELDFAACFVDTASSQFYLTKFTDKSGDFPLLETLIAQIRPKELIIARGNLSKYALKVIKNNTSVETLWETIKPDTEFWDAETARREIDLETYFPGDASSQPQFLVNSLNTCDLSASVIGGLVWYLRTLKLDKQLIGLGQFHEYTSALNLNGASMVVDGQTLQNLEVFANSWDGSAEGTLFKLINNCITPFGKRRLRSWIIHPLRNIRDIAFRADAIEMFMEQDEVADTLSNKLINLPDTERMLSRVHAGALRPRDFVRLVGGLESMARLLTWINDLKSQLPQLEPFLGPESTAGLEKTIEPWLSAFDHVAAKEQDKLIPEHGVDEEFDLRKQEVEQAEQALHEVMKQYRQEFKSNALEYRDSGKEIYLIEVPAKLVKQVPRDWQQMGATAKFKRYWSPKVKMLVRTLQEAQERLNLTAAACQRNLYYRFCSSENYNIFMEASRVISALDCLLSLSKTSSSMAVHCRPEFISTSETNPVIQFDELRHPVATNTDFIPNDINLGGDDARLSLLTGANAAGKSTVLRTTCCAVLLAQLGCHVPAKAARLTPVDRIMTRLGASDNIFAGKSTFHMELAETERILSESTANSLVVIDELGRGGSSSDGFAIAESVLHQLATHIGCMGFFATHYATLYDSFESHPGVKPERMAIEVDSVSRVVTFLYKLEAGRSEGSFGMNVAAMCGVSADIVNAAELAAQKYEHTSQIKKKLSYNGQEAVTLGTQSDVAWCMNHDVNDLAIRVMLAMSK